MSMEKQAEFEKLSGDEQKKQIGESHEEAKKIYSLAQEFAGLYNEPSAANLDEANNKIERERNLNDKQRKTKNYLTNYIGRLDSTWWEEYWNKGSRVDIASEDFFERCAEVKMPKEVREDILEDSVVKLLENGLWWYVFEVKAKIQEPPRKELNSNRIAVALKKGIVNILSRGELHNFILDEEDGSDYRVNKEGVEKVKKLFSIEDDLINDIKQSPEVIYAAALGVANKVADPYRERGQSEILKRKFKLDDNKELLLQAAEEVFVECLDEGRYLEYALNVKKHFNLSEDVINAQETQQVAKNHLARVVAENNGVKDFIENRVKEMRETFNLSDEMIEEAELEGIRYAFIKLGHPFEAIAIQQVAKFSKSKFTPEIIEAAKKSINIYKKKLKNSKRDQLNEWSINSIKRQINELKELFLAE